MYKGYENQIMLIELFLLKRKKYLILTIFSKLNM